MSSEIIKRITAPDARPQTADASLRPSPFAMAEEAAQHVPAAAVTFGHEHTLEAINVAHEWSADPFASNLLQLVREYTVSNDPRRPEGPHPHRPDSPRHQVLDEALTLSAFQFLSFSAFHLIPFATMPEITLIHYKQLLPSPTQPRTHFFPEAMEEQRASIALRGIITPLIVRPFPGSEGKFELIAGECRWRNVADIIENKRPVAKPVKKLALLPCIVRTDLTDDEVEKLQFEENDKRNNLTKSEEVRFVQRMLEKRNGGLPVYTAETLAFALNKPLQWVRDCRDLAILPQEVMVDLDARRLTVSAAREAAMIRDEASRLRFCEDMRRGVGLNFLSPDGSPLTQDQARNLRLGKYCASLKGAAFDLVEEGISGQVACVRCPHYMLPEEAGHAAMCGNPGCLEAKRNDKWTVTKRAAEESRLGITVLEGDAAVVHLKNKDFVDLDADIPPSDLAAHYDGRKVKTWRGVADLDQVKCYLVRDPGTLKFSYRASREQIIAAANQKARESAQKPALIDAAVMPSDQDAAFAAAAEENKKTKAHENRVAMKLMELVGDRLAQSGLCVDAAPVIIECMVKQMTPAAVAFLCRVYALKPDTGKESRVLADFAKERATTKPMMEAWLGMLCITPWVVAHGPGDAGLRELCGAQGLDLEQMQREARALVGRK